MAVVKSQNQQVLDHMLDHGYITPLIAQSYGIQRLGARIQDLKYAGIRVIAEIRRNDMGKRYAYYTLGSPGLERDLRAQGYGYRANEVLEAA